MPRQRMSFRWWWRRTLEKVSLLRVLRDWQYDGYGNYPDPPRHTWRSRAALELLWWWEIIRALWYAVFGAAGDDLEQYPWWKRALYRAKAVVCLGFGLHYKGEHYEFDGVEVVWWDGEMVGYYEPEWESSRLEVGYGLGNWRVLIDLRANWMS